MCCNGHSVHASPADRIQLPVKSSQTDRAARALHGRQRSPGIVPRVVFESDIQCAHMDVSCETADDIDLSIHPDSTRMTHAARYRRTNAPTIRRRIVFFDQLLIVSSQRRAAQDINLSIYGSDGYLAARFR